MSTGAKEASQPELSKIKSLSGQRMSSEMAHCRHRNGWRVMVFAGVSSSRAI